MKFKTLSLLMAAVMTASIAVGSAVPASAASAASASTGEFAAPTQTPPNYSENKIYFYANPNLWKNVSTPTFYLYSYSEDFELFPWGSKKGKMTNEGGGFWSFDLADKGFSFAQDASYGCTFTDDWGAYTCDLIIDSQNLGDVAYMTSAMSESAIESNKQCYYAKWKSQHNGAPLRITPLGNVVGEVCWPGATPSSMLYDFITDTSMGGLKNAVKYTGMTEQQRIDATAKALGLSRGEVKALVTEANKHGADVNWTAQSSTLPGAKPALTLSNKSNGIRAEWNKINGATKYIVYYKKNADSKWNSTETANTYYPLLSLAAGTQYAVQVQPVFGAVKDAYSSVARLVYVPQVKPALKLSNKSNGIRAEWNKINGATKYIVYYKKNADSKWSSTETANTYYPLLKLAAGTQYAVQVQPVFGASKGLYSSVARLVYVPQVKPAVKLSNKSNGIRAEWGKVSGATKYIVYYKKNADSKWNSTETANTYYPLLRLAKGTQYAVQVQPVFGASKGLYSSVARLVYQPTGSTSSTPTPTMTRTGSNGLRVSWPAVSGADKYILYYKVESGAWSTFELPYTYADFTPMVKGVKYSFQLQPVKGGTKGAYSKVAVITY